MKTHITTFLLFLGLVLSSFAQPQQPINNGVLRSDLNAAGHNIGNAAGITISNTAFHAFGLERYNLADQEIFDDSAVSSANFQLRYLTRSPGSRAVNWQDSILTDNDEVASVEWQDRSLKNSSGVGTLNWETRTLVGDWGIPTDAEVAAKADATLVSAFDVFQFGATGNGSTDDRASLQAAAYFVTRTNGAPRSMFLRYGTYKILSEVEFNANTGTDGTIHPSVGTGDYTVLGNSARILSHSPTNAIRIVNGMRRVMLKEFAMTGTNVTKASNANHVGIILDGPNGHLTVDTLLLEQFTVGVIGDDITDLDMRNVWFTSNFVGLASAYKPDNWRVHGRFERNSYGVFLSYTNSEFITDNGYGWPTISGTFGYNRVGIIVPKGGATIGPLYSEGTTHATIQLGMDTSNPYEANYGNDGAAPQVRIRGWDCNGADVARVYRASTLWLENCHPGYFTVRLENAAADGSTVESDATVYVRRSDGVTLTIGDGIRYVNGALVPISKMSWTNVTDVAVGTGLQYSNATLAVNLLPWATAYWKMDETSGVRSDSVGNEDMYSLGDSYESGSGKIGLAATNYGVTAALATTPSTNLSYTGPWTLGGWFQAANVDGNRILAGKSNEFTIYYTGSANNRARVSFGNADLLINESWSATAPNGTTSLKFVCAWWDGTTLYAQSSAGTIYSTNLSTSAGAITPPTPVSSSFVAGQVIGGTSLAAVDEVFYARRVLTTAERSALYNAGAGSTYTPINLAGDGYSIENLNAKNITGEKYPHVFNVLDYGAKNDGSAVVNLAVQAAVDAAQAYSRANGGRGATVYAPTGDYLFGTNNPYTTLIENHYNGILFSNALNISLVGDGIQKTTFRLPTNSLDVMNRWVGGGWNWFGATNTIGLNFRGITFNAYGYTNPGVEIVHAYNTTNAIFEHCEFMNSSADCLDIHIDNSPGSIEVSTNILNIVRNCVFKEWGVNGGWGGVFASGNAIGIVSPMKIHDNVFWMPWTNGLDSYAIVNTGGRVSHIHDNLFVAQQVLQNNRSNDRLENNHFFLKTNVGANVISAWGYNTGNLVVKGNYFYADSALNQNANWVRVWHTNGFANEGNITIENNHFGTCGVIISLRQDERVTVKNNRFFPSSANAAALMIRGTNNARVEVVGNTVYNGSHTTFHLGNADSDRFHNAVFSFNTGVQSSGKVWHQGTNNTIQGNHFTMDSTTTCFVAGFGFCTNWTILDNTFGGTTYVRNRRGVISGNRFRVLDATDYVDGTRIQDNKWDSITVNANASTNAIWINNDGPPSTTFQWASYGTSLAIAQSTNIVPVWNAAQIRMATDTNSPGVLHMLTNNAGNVGWHPK